MWSTVTFWLATRPRVLTRPCVCFTPTLPVPEAGMRTEPAAAGPSGSGPPAAAERRASRRRGGRAARAPGGRPERQRLLAGGHGDGRAAARAARAVVRAPRVDA